MRGGTIRGNRGKILFNRACMEISLDILDCGGLFKIGGGTNKYNVETNLRSRSVSLCVAQMEWNYLL